VARALVTGASSGIGAAFATQLATAAHDLVVVARREQRLLELADRLRGEHGVEVSVEVVDLASREGLDRLVDRVPALEIDVLVNNAGFGAYRPFLQLDPARARDLVSVLILAPTLLTRAALPGMVDRGRGTIINVASALAFSGAMDDPWLPARATYAAAKSYLVTFSQILASELDGTGVTVQVLCPRVVATEFHEIQGMDVSRAPQSAADDVVRASLAAVGNGEVICLPALDDPNRVTEWKAATTALVRG
jgi:uncharacterized protein